MDQQQRAILLQVDFGQIPHSLLKQLFHFLKEAEAQNAKLPQAQQQGRNDKLQSSLRRNQAKWLLKKRKFQRMKTW